MTNDPANVDNNNHRMEPGSRHFFHEKDLNVLSSDCFCNQRTRQVDHAENSLLVICETVGFN
jgi:hypothetical protein